MNSRKKIKFRSYGMSVKEAKELFNKEKENKSNPINVHCGYMDYHITNNAQAEIIREAKRLYLVRKHAGSKPLNKLKKHIASMRKTIAKYTEAYNKMQRLKNRVNGEDN